MQSPLLCALCVVCGCTSRLTGLAGLEFVIHAPDAVGLTALNSLEWSGAVKGAIRLFKPGTDSLGRDLSFPVWRYLQ